MIRIFGYIDPNTDEYQAAINLQQLIMDSWPSVKNSTQDHIYIVVEAKCHGQEIRDIDLLVLGTFKSGLSYKPYLQFTNADGDPELPEEIIVESFCLVIELKAHSFPNIRISGNNVEVLYKRSEWHNVSQQNEGQKQSLMKYLKLQGFTKIPWVIPLIWLRNVSAIDLPRRPHNILGSEANWELFINVIGQLHAPRNRSDQWILSAGLVSREIIEEIAAALTKVINPTEIDRRRMEQINQKLSSELGLADLVGKHLVILRGRGGTGKTLHLLQLAKHLYDERASRVLVLTYNRALVADLRRLMTIMGIGDGVAEKSIHIQTCYSFFYQIMKTLGVVSKNEEEFLENYSEFKKETLDLLSSNAINYEDIQNLLQADTNKFAWDFIFVDEGQDWPNDEREILFKLFGYNFFTIADGIDQLIRGETPANWRGHLRQDQTKILPLKKCLRMKAGLTFCVSSFAAKFGLQQSEWEANQFVPGGHIVIYENENLGSTEKLIDELISNTKSAGNEPIDMLFCVPSTMVHTNPNLSKSSYSIPLLFKSWGLKIWDGTSSSERDSYPTENDQLRIVQYESCRGLEGWSVVLFGLDDFYLSKLNQIQNNNSNEAQAKLLTARWLMIPLTRAMDTLVIHLSSKNSVVKDVLKDIASQYESLVEWRRF